MSALDYLGPVKAPTRVIAAEVSAAITLPDYPAPYNGPVMWGYNSGGAEHGTGRAIDFMIRNSPAVGDAVAEYLWEHRERLGLIHLIWRQRIRSTVVSPGVWRPMADRGSPTNNHMDHVHAFFDGRDVTSSGRTGAQSTPTKPKASTKGKPAAKAPAFPLPRGSYFGPKSGPASSVSGYYSHRADLKRWQQQMRKRGWSLTADGLYGPRTASVARSFQKDKGLARDGLIGASTWAAAFTEPVT